MAVITPCRSMKKLYFRNSLNQRSSRSQVKDQRQGFGRSAAITTLLVLLFSAPSLVAQPVIGNNSFNNGATTNTTLAPVGTPTPFTRTLMGWDITHSTTTTGALTHQYTGGEQFLQFSTPTGANFNYLEFASSTGLDFKLNSLEIGSITRALTFDFTGYRDGVAVPGATYSASQPIFPSSSANYGVVNFPNTGAFNNIDRIRVSFSTVQAGSLFIRVDDINIATAVPGTMPLTLLDFTAGEDNEKIELRWVTASEINVDRFEIEKSKDGAAFQKIGTLTARGNNSLSNTHYIYSDVQPTLKAQYYRIKMVDFDGQYTYSPTQRVNAAAGSGNAFLYPNPVKGNTITVHSIASLSAPLSYQIIDNLGQVIQAALLNSGAQKVTIKTFTPGLYLVKLGDGTVLKFQKN